MRTKLFVMLVLVASLVLMCSKKDDTPTAPSDTNGDGGETTTSFMLINHNIFTELPNFVTVLLQVTDLNGKGADFLTLDRFQIEEEGIRLNNSDASAYVLKKSSINYTVRTKILIDNNAGTNLDALKKGALKLVQSMDFQQEIAVYTVSDSLNMVIDFTSDVNALTGAINGITEGSAACKLYDGIMSLKRFDSDVYELSNVIQHTYAVFTDSNDDGTGGYSQEAIGPLTSKIKIFTVGFGSVDGTKLDAVGVAYFGAADETAILDAAVKAQTEIVKYANSFYRLSYRSTLRESSGHLLEITVAGNTNTGENSILEASFSSSSFIDVSDGLYINWSYAAPQGIEMVVVQAGTSRMVKLLSIGGSKQATFQASSSNTNTATATVGTGDLLTVTAKGAVGDSTTVTVTDAANNLTKQIIVKIISFDLGSVLFEKWTEVTGGLSGLLNNSRYPDQPSNSEKIINWEIPTDVSDNYGTRIRGYLHPLTTGSYIFWIASDDQSQLFLSTDGDPANAEKVCEVTSWTNSREWNKEKNQKSAAIELKAGKHYYIETIHIEGTGGDNLAVAWQAEKAKEKEIIAGDYISPWEGE
ncbi:hypothetical protein EH223_13115 [candidate division KSB1 bacterium]|nr:hypothetical protein [candidate division KSB1 bacterium]RQW02178.1 MAG: hypothetical protein EH223_13115 [candidate division KSB1 bacterium]